LSDKAGAQGLDDRFGLRVHLGRHGRAAFCDFLERFEQPRRRRVLQQIPEAPAQSASNTFSSLS
jgi:hypothetical protein